MVSELGKLEELDARKAWQNEARDFTPWLAEDEGLALLSDAIDMELELEDTEVPVGPYFADIVARDLNSKLRVVIENQLEKTDHDHLGKSIVYASGLDASVIVWIATAFTDDHRSALEFLNKMAAPGLRCFGLEVKLWSISGSPPAPHFDVLVSPNEYNESVRIRDKALTETNALYLEFWQGFRSYLTDHGVGVRTMKPFPENWYSVSVGKTGFLVTCTVSVRKKTLGCELYMAPAVSSCFEQLLVDKPAIEKELGELVWDAPEQGRGAHVSRSKAGADVRDRAAWQSCFSWLAERLERFHKTFAPLVSELDTSGAGVEAE